jgi:hypothetical protein
MRIQSNETISTIKSFFCKIFLRHLPYTITNPMEIVMEQQVGKQIKDHLDSNGISQRWLFNQLIDRKVEMSEARLSNRLNYIGKTTFSQIELDAINEILKTDFKLTA